MSSTLLVRLAMLPTKMIAAETFQHWVGFVLSPSWPKYKRESEQHLEFGDKIRVETGSDRGACAFLDRAMQNRGAL